MIENLVVVGARLNSSRLPKKHLLPLSGQPVIQRIFQRLQECSSEISPVLATTADDYNRPLVDWADAQGVSVFPYAGGVDDLVGRIDAIVDDYKPQRLIYICGDCPLVEPSVIDHYLARLLENPELDSVTVGLSPDGEKSINEGIQGYTYKGWKLLVSLSQTALEREHVGLGWQESKQPKRDTIQSSTASYALNHRISVDTYADFLFMAEVYKRWFQQHDEQTIVDLDWVVTQLINHPELVEINQHVLQKSAYKAYGKVAFLIDEAGVSLAEIRYLALLALRLQEASGIGVKFQVLGDERDLSLLKHLNAEWFESKTAWLSSAANCATAVVFSALQADFAELADLCSRLKLNCPAHLSLHEAVAEEQVAATDYLKLADTLDRDLEQIFQLLD